MFCHRCGHRLPLNGRGGGVAYRRTQAGQPTSGGQSALAIAFVLLAGLMFAGGALAVFVSAPRASGTPSPFSGAIVPPTSSSLPIFVQPTASPSPSPSPFLTPSPLVSSFPSPFLSPSPIILPTASPTSTPRPTNPPTPPPTPDATPVNCEVSTSPDQTAYLGIGNAQSRGPLQRAWCIHRVTVRPFESYGITRLIRGNNELFEARCVPNDPPEPPGPCQAEYVHDFDPPQRAGEGSTLRYEFTCIDNWATAEVDECNDGIEDGSTIQIDYETFAGP